MILALDPGETTGVCIFKSPTEFESREIKHNLVAIGDLIKEVKPKIIVYERFVLYPAFAKHLVWDEMYTSQVIGVIKYEGQKLGSDLIAQSASDKDYVVYPKIISLVVITKKMLTDMLGFIVRNNLVFK